jgi:hypothetical protein
MPMKPADWFTSSGTWMAKVPGPFTMVCQRPSPGFFLVMFSTKTISSDSGAWLTSWAARAAI